MCYKLDITRKKQCLDFSSFNSIIIILRTDINYMILLFFPSLPVYTHNPKHGFVMQLVEKQKESEGEGQQEEGQRSSQPIKRLAYQSPGCLQTQLRFHWLREKTDGSRALVQPITARPCLYSPPISLHNSKACSQLFKNRPILI